MRRDGDKARDFAERHGVPRWYDDGDALIADPDVDVVYISTPPDTHKEYTLKVAAAGKPVFCEKPMARNLDECREMIEACDAAGVPLWVAFYRRSMPRFLKIKELLDGKAIGDVDRGVDPDVPTSGDRARRPVPRTVLGLHARRHRRGRSSGSTPDAIRSICSTSTSDPWPRSTVSPAICRDIYPTPDTVTVSFAFESGCRRLGNVGIHVGRRARRDGVHRHPGKITFAVSAPTPFTVVDDDGTRSFDIGYPEWVHQPMVESIVAEMRGEGRCSSTGSSAARAQPGSLTRCCEVLVLVDLLDVGSDQAYSHEMRRNL